MKNLGCIIRLSYLLPLFSLLSFFTLCSEPFQVNIEGEAAILMNAETGTILFEKNARTALYPASTTKVATALYALKTCDSEVLDIPIKVEANALICTSQEQKLRSKDPNAAYWLETDGMHIGLKEEEELTLRDLLKGMLIPSGNDAANMIACFVGGTIPNFMQQLNRYLKEIGCYQTHFCNPHGLHYPQHQTTAYDLALITCEALKNPVFCEIVSQTRFVRPKTNKQKAVTLLQTNRLLRPGNLYYSKAVGVKTGYHARAKHAFIGAARFQERTLIAVLLGCPNRKKMFEEATLLFERAFNQPKVKLLLLKAGVQEFKQQLPQAKQSLLTYLDRDLSLTYYPAENPQPKCLLYWNVPSLPIQEGQKVGELHLVSSVNGEILKKAPLLALEKVNLKWPYDWINNFKQFIHNYPNLAKMILGFLLMILLGGGWLIWKTVR